MYTSCILRAFYVHAGAAIILHVPGTVGCYDTHVMQKLLFIVFYVSVTNTKAKYCTLVAEHILFGYLLFYFFSLFN